MSDVDLEETVELAAHAYLNLRLHEERGLPYRDALSHYLRSRRKLYELLAEREDWSTERVTNEQNAQVARLLYGRAVGLLIEALREAGK
ncbi:hypothetical protein [Actinomadura oligospora]|uniref:hypothetical protein n=1 Tax=Actinomadura oligospora TaxID=111804 RepID=UPI0012FA8ACA|nr:hypothetical protein [Actinomadura oligospora]